MNILQEKLMRHISKEQKLAFIGTFVIGIITHLFMLSNKIPNHDDIGQIYDAMSRPRHGRWFLFFPSQISSDLSLPWFNGILGIIYIALCTMIIIWLFQVKSNICIVSISAIMVTFPTVASTFNYMQAGDAYFFCLLLACLAVPFTVSSIKLYWLIAAVLLTLSMGIYQSYLPFAVALLVIWHIKELLIEDRDVWKVLFSGIKSVCIISISTAAYWVITKLVLKHYGGEFIDHIEGFVLEDLSIKNMAKLILTACKKSLAFYLLNESVVHYTYMNYVYFLVVVMSIIFSSILFKKYNHNKNKMKFLLLIFLYAALPLAAGLIYCMCSQVHMLMVYGFAALPLFLVMLTDWIEKSNITMDGIKKNLLHLAQLATVFIVLLTSFNYALVSNKAYLTLYLTYEQSYAYANRLMTEIQMQEEFDKHDKIVLIGYPVVDTEYTMPWLEERDVQSLRGVTPSLVNQYTFNRYLRYYLGVEQEISQIASLNQFENLGVDIVLDEMNCYPNAGSITCEENTIFVKFNNLQ